MCLVNDSKARRFQIALASACLALGLMLPMLFHPEAPSARNLLDFVRGLLIGVSGSINLSLVWRNSRQRRLGSGPRL